MSIMHSLVPSTTLYHTVEQAARILVDGVRQRGYTMMTILSCLCPEAFRFLEQAGLHDTIRWV